MKSHKTELIGLLNKEDVNSFLQDWTRVATRSSIKIISLKIGNPTQVDFSKILQEQITLNAQELPIDLTLIGKFDSFKGFFRSLERMRRLPRIDKMQIKLDEGANPDLKVEMQLKLYIGG